MRGEAKSADEVGVQDGTRFVLGTVEVGADGQAGLSFGGAKEVEDLLIAVQRFASPIFGDPGEPAMLNGVPLGSAVGIVGKGQGEIEAIAELGLCW